MKRVYIAVAFLIIAVTLCVIEQRTVTDVYNRSTELISQAQQAVNDENYKEAERLCTLLSDLWEKKYPLLSAMIDHDSLENAVLGASTIKELAKNRSDSLEDALTELDGHMRDIRDEQKISFGNIF